VTHYTVEVGRCPALVLSVPVAGDDTPDARVVAVLTAKREARFMGFSGPAQIVKVEPVKGIEVLP
jgi:hypothetical protein